MEVLMSIYLIKGDIHMVKVVIVGGSYAGVKAGKTLHKIFKRNNFV